MSRQPPDPNGVLVIDGPIADGDLPLLCERLRALATRGEDVVCDVRALAADAVSVNVLARLQLTARRHGCRVRLWHASSALDQLLSFVGLADVLALGGPLCLEPQRQPEEREHARRIEERVDRDDAPA